MADIASSKAASKKKPKKESSSANAPPPPIPIEIPISNADQDEKMNGEQAHESAWMRDLSKQIRNINKKINGMAKTDAILAENPGVSLDQLVASRKMNADQKLQAERKPGLQAELNQLKTQQEQIRRFEEEQNKKMAMALDEVRLQHQQELESVRAATVKPPESGTSKVELRESLLILSQFLRAAAARRVEANDDSDESRAFEGVLLLLYGGDATAVDAAEKLVTGSTEEVPSTEGHMLSVSYAQVRELSNQHSPYAAEEAWIQGVAQSEGAPPGGLSDAAPVTDPTILNAGLTEIDDQTAVTPTPADTVQNPGAAQMDTGAANISASDSWDKPTSADPMADSWVSVPRDPTETETQPTGSAPGATQNWADDAPETAMESMSLNNDGFREVRHSRGRASYGGEQRGRGRGGPRGDRGRGGPRGSRGDGSFTGGRGGRGGGRGARGGRGGSGEW